jgi:Leucine-rich repeat (LRR) protein
MKQLLVATLLCATVQSAFGADTDGDGLLDLLDVPGFDPRATGFVSFTHLATIEDLDGANLLANATHLNLRGNLITSLESGDFEGLSNLQSLLVAWNQITSLESGDFDGMSNLQSLELSGNRITGLESDTLDGLSNLQSLFVGWNQITSLESGDFDGLSNLQRLDLEGNQITSLESGDLEVLGNLQVLVLGYNQITSLESGDFDGLSNLRALGLDGNRIPSLESGDFDRLSNLQGLYLYGNRITNIADGAFHGLNKLESLELGGNDITQLNLTGATFDALDTCFHDLAYNSFGFCVDSGEISDLTLDLATLSRQSFEAIVEQTQFISTASLVGLRFSDADPEDLSILLAIPTLDDVRVDRALYDLYVDEFNAFAALPGNTVSIVPEPTGTGILLGILGIAAACRVSVPRRSH